MPAPTVRGTPDATLSALRVDGVGVPDFTSDTAVYKVGVAAATATVTVVGTPTMASATVGCDTDTEPGTDGCQVPLAASGGTTVEVIVSEGPNTGTYTLTINRGLEGTFQWKASDDIYGFTRAVPATRGSAGASGPTARPSGR